MGEQGERVLSTDEMTGGQALERKHPGLPLQPDVAALSGVTEELGVKDKRGILHNCASRAAFLSDLGHKVVCHYTPKHSSWVNQVEIGLGIVVRKLLKRGNFTSVADLATKIRAFIDYYNETMAKPVAWTYRGKALAA